MEEMVTGHYPQNATTLHHHHLVNVILIHPLQQGKGIALIRPGALGEMRNILLPVRGGALTVRPWIRGWSTAELTSSAKSSLSRERWAQGSSSAST